MTTRPNRTLAVIVGLAVVAAVIATIAAATRPAAQYSPDSPEGTVQAYLTALMRGDGATAVGHLDPALRCDAADLDRTWINRDARIELLESTITGTSAVVRVDVINRSGAGPFENSWSEQQTFRLTKTGDTWRISSRPWPLYECGVSTK